jgi:hypothetical protein
MKTFLKSVLFNNVQLKLFSLILGYVCWSIISETRTDDVWMDIPVCFYQAENNTQIEAPEMVKVRLTGKRPQLRTLDTNKTAVHIDTRNLSDGEQIIALSEHHIMVPDNVQVTGWAPTHMNIKVKKNST